MANVNIWGPQAWSVLHGLCGLCTPSLCATPSLLADIHYQALAKILDLLRILLPCSLCLNSYRKFYLDIEVDLKHSILDELRNGNAFSLCYTLHNLVNKKLFDQRRADLYLGPLDSEKISMLDERFHKVQNIPTLLVVEKRFMASDSHPFSEEAVWTLLASFCVHIEKEKTETAKRERIQAIPEFCKSLLSILVLGQDYEELKHRLMTFISLFTSLTPDSTSIALDLMCYAKCDMLRLDLGGLGRIQTLQLISSSKSDTYQHRQTIKKKYLEALFVQSCSVTTCA